MSPLCGRTEVILPQKIPLNNKQHKYKAQSRKTSYGDEDINKIRTVSADYDYREEGAFFPPGMQPFEVAELLETDLVSGLSRKQIRRRAVKHGANIIQNEYKLSFVQSIKNQLKGISGALLITCSLVMYAFDRQYSYIAMAGMIAALMLFNAILESSAFGALNIPRKYSAIKTSVTREGITDITDSRRLVPGDIIYFYEGMVIPCDARLIDDKMLSVLETPVSGNRSSVIKDSSFIARSDNELVYPNMVYAGSIVTSGEGSAIVCSTGKDTLIRRTTADKRDYQPNLLKYIKNTCKYTSIIALVACFVLLFTGVIVGRDITGLFIVSLSVGAVALCDSMAALAAASLGYGAKKMAYHGSVVKNLNCITGLCETNTIMCSKNIAFPPQKMNLSGIYIDNIFQPADKKLNDRTKELLYLFLACSDIRVNKQSKKRIGTAKFAGTLHDQASAVYLSEKGYDVTAELSEFFRIQSERSLSGEINRALILYKGRNLVVLKGAPEFILSRCTGYDLNGTGYKLSGVTRKRILAALEEHSQKNGYIIAIAVGETTADNLRDITAEKRLMFKGFITLYGSLDVNIASAVYKCNQSGIETVVSCSDSFYTAFNTAKNAGIINAENQVVTAEQMRSCDRGLFIANCPDYKLFLNLMDSEWLQILKYRRQEKRTVGVTAERTEDLPLMKEANISFVPDSAPDTLKQSADVLLLSGGIDTLADCLQYARLIFVRIHSVAEFLAVGATSLFLSVFLSLIFGLELPFRVQDILFGGIVFNLFFAISLAFLPANRKLLLEKLPKYGHSPSFFDFLNPLIYSSGAALCLMLIFGLTGSYSSTLLGFTALLFLYALTNISRTSIFRKKSVYNLPLLLALFVSSGIMAALFFIQPMRDIFIYTEINSVQLGISLAVSGGYFIILQLITFSIKQKTSERKNALITQNSERKV